MNSELSSSNVTHLPRDAESYAAIKAEYIDHHHKPKIAEEFLPQPVTEQLKEGSATAGDGKDGERPPKRPRLKGRNKKRPIEKNPDAKEKMCPMILNEMECRFGNNCRYRHDVDTYLASKPPDLGNKCHNYDTWGKCPFSYACRFASEHLTTDMKNKIDIPLYEKMKDQKKALNVMEKDLQTKLWKKKYDFTHSDTICKSVKKQLEDGGWGSQPFAKNTNGLGQKAAPQDKLTAGLSAVKPEPEEVCDQHMDTGCENWNISKSDVSVGHPVVNSSDSLVVSSEGASSLNSVPPTAGPDDTLKVDSHAPLTMLTSRRDLGKKKIDFKGKLYLAPLTTVGNLPFRRVCKGYGADITCGEMAMCPNILQGQSSEWALLKRHPTEDLFGIQICGSYADTMSRTVQLVTENLDVDFIDINCGCPIDMVFKRGEGSALMGRPGRLEHIVRSLTSITDVPVTLKMRTGIYEDKYIAHTLSPKLRDWGVSMVTIHGRSREQRYTRLANWDYIDRCAKAASPLPIFGNGDVLSYEDYYRNLEQTSVSGNMIARGAIIKPWIFKEIKERNHWDISASERLDMLRDFTNSGLEYWGSDQQGVTTTRRFLLEWLSFLYRYIPVGLLERLPQRINEKPPYYFGRNDLETLMASPNCADWIKISEMLLGPVPSGFTFLPKHKANSYK